MIVGLIISGVIGGAVAALFGMLSGLSFLGVLASYTVAGVATMALVAGLLLIKSTSSERVTSRSSVDIPGE